MYAWMSHLDSHMVQQQYVNWIFLHFHYNLQWCHFLIPPPPVSKLSNELCTRERKARHSKTLADFAELDNMGPPQTWTCLAAGTVGAILMDARWAEMCPQSTHGSIATTTRALTLSTLALFEFDGRKITNYESEWSARQHIYVLMSNNRTR